jgi:hypothetical protein
MHIYRAFCVLCGVPNTHLVYFEHFSGGYVCVTSASLGGVVLGAAFLAWRMRSFKWVPVKKEVKYLVKLRVNLVKTMYATA